MKREALRDTNDVIVMKMRIDVITIFPEMFASVLGNSILKRAQDAGHVTIELHNLRDYTTDRRRTVDDRPFGGGPGMVMMPEPIFKAIEAIEAKQHGASRPARDAATCQVVLMAPTGERFHDAMARQLSELSHLVIVCGHYEGVDARIREALADREISIGDYVLTGGELPAMVVIDGVVRLIPGVVGHAAATSEDSFASGLLEYPQYTRPVAFRGMEVPEVLRSGDHKRIATWRKLQAVGRTMTRRPDLLTHREPNGGTGNGRRRA